MTPGQCNRCGECCKVIPILLKGMSPETKEWLLARGAKEDRKQGYLLIPHVCEQLEDELEYDPITEGHIKTGKTRCRLHDTARYPLACARYHGFGHFYKPEGCGYLEKD